MTHIRIPTLLKRIGLIGGSLVIAALVATNVVLASATDNFFGYAWSTNVGWVKVNNCVSPTDCAPGTSYGLAMASSGTQRAITGYAWSSNIGWITFYTQEQTPWDRTQDPGEQERLIQHCPTGAGPNCRAYVDWGATGGTSVPVKGWARACSVYNDCTRPSRGLRPDWERGGWDGWIALNDMNSTDGASYGVTFNTTTGALSGYGWGSGVVGWVDFSGITVTGDQCPVTPPEPLPGGFINNCQTCNPGEPCWCAKYPDNPLCVNTPMCPGSNIPIPPTGPADCPVVPQCPDDSGPAPGGDINNCNNNDCSVVGSACWCAQNGNPVPQCGPSGGPTGGGSGDQCTNIPPQYEPVTIVPPYRQLPDGRCLCIPGYVLNAQYQCVKPVYVEPKQ